MVTMEMTKTFRWSINWKHHTTLSFLSSDTHQIYWETKHKSVLLNNLCFWVNYMAPFEKYTSWQLTSFLRSLLSLCRCHLMTACGERAWHSRKVLLPSTPYCTISRVFLLAAGQRERDFHGNQNTHYHELLYNQNLSCGKWAPQLPQIIIKLPAYRHYSQ